MMGKAEHCVGASEKIPEALKQIKISVQRQENKKQRIKWPSSADTSNAAVKLRSSCNEDVTDRCLLNDS